MGRRVLPAGLSALLVACSPSVEQSREAAHEALARGDRDAALVALGELRESQHDSAETVLGYAQLLVQAGEAPEAAWVLEDAIGQFPGHDELRLARGNVALLLSDPARARSVVETISEESEHHVDALLIQARAELALGNLEEGLATFAEAETDHPDRPAVRIPRIATLLAERRFDEARAALAEARDDARAEEVNAALDWLEVMLYGVEAEAGDREAAVAGLRGFVEAHPHHVLAWHSLVRLLIADGRPAEALELVATAIEADSDQLALYPMLASLQTALGRRREAEASLRQLLERNPSPSTHVALAQFYVDGGEEERGLQTLRAGLTRHPEDPMLLKIRTEALVSFDRVAEARTELARFEALAQGDPYARYLRARIELAEGEAEAAARRLEQLIPDLDIAATQFWLGRALEEIGDLAGAERRYGLAMVRDPVDSAPPFAMVRLAEARGDWRTSAGFAQLSVRRAPGQPEAWAALVAALANLAEGPSAEAAAGEAVELFPDRADLIALHAVALRTQGRHAEALDVLDTARERLGEQPELAAERIITLGASGRLAEGISVAREALERSPGFAPIHYALAALLFAAGEARDGARAVDRALELDPEDLRPLRLRAEFRAATGRIEGARADCETYLARRPDDPMVHFVLGVVQEKAGRTDDAISSYRRAAELDGRGFAPRNNLARLLALDGDLDTALTFAQEAYAIADGNPHVMDTLGWLYHRKGLVARSISILEDAQSADPDLPDTKLHLALAYRDVGRTEDARRLLVELRAHSEASAELRMQAEDALAALR